MDEFRERSERVTKWYQAVKRDLPWRNTRDPYRIWISEIMLQQTRVETVKAYYHRFLERFPTVQALACAPEQDVLKCWEGLGYYSRARNMQKAAVMVTTMLGGHFPQNAAALRKLPGIGEYTAGAVASIAYGEAIPAIDGNVKRVGARLFGIRTPIDAKESRTVLYSKIAAMLQMAEPGDLNQALMELGATLCTPRMPKCEACPLALLCDANAEGDADMLPVLQSKASPKAVDMAVCLITYGREILLLRRTERLLQGLYTFYLIEGETVENRITDALRDVGIQATYQGILGEARHIFTHRVWHMTMHHLVMAQPPNAAWLETNLALMATGVQVQALPIPTAMKAAKSAAITLLG